jgi:hypothetical protein
VSDARDDAELEGPGGEDDDFEAPRRSRSEDRVRPRELVLLAVTVLAVAATVLFGLRWKDLHDEEVERQDVETAASEFLNAMFEWDGATINEDFDRILGFATGEFEEEARTTFADDTTRQDLAENQASERADSVDVFVQSIEGDDARVFGVVQVRAVNASLPTPRADTVRVEVGMTHEGGEWKVYDFNVFDGLSLGLPVEPTDAATNPTTTTVPS